MILKTGLFGEVDTEKVKVINFPKGIIGYPNLQKFTLISDKDSENKGLNWLLSLSDPSFAMPVIDPLIVKQDYNPMVKEDMLEPIIGKLTEDNLFILVTVTVPEKIEDISVNLATPIIINTESLKGTQVIVENDDYEVKYRVYNILKKDKDP
ncbi:MAG: flagellar assembly protein FliW [Lachnospiraceae bacterium]|nr:flagellar assembly protein FliW [Lachnospiraceae bacterium]